jgi:hypothetical protein
MLPLYIRWLTPTLDPHKPEKYDNETYGLLRNDWKTTVEDYRMEGMRELMGIW